MENRLGPAIDAQLEKEILNLVKSIEDIKSHWSARGFSILPSSAFKQIDDLCTATMDKTFDIALAVFRHQQRQLQDPAAIAELRDSLLDYLEARLNSIAQTALYHANRSGVFTNHHFRDDDRFRIKQSSLLAQARWTTGAD